MKKLSKELGITLVALVVTIIILLILAGVAINMALGDNGLFKKSKEAVNTWKSAEENEAGVSGYLDEEWQNLINGGSGAEPTTPEEPEKPIIGNTVDEVKELVKTKTASSEVPITVTIAGKEVVVPPKFTLAGSDAENPGGQTVPEGVVTIDPLGNEWVWIPCYVPGGKGSTAEDIASGAIQYDRYPFSKTGWERGQTKLEELDSDGSYKIVRDDKKEVYYFHEGLLTTSKEYLSIKKYGGYYIARYEAGDKEATKDKISRTKETGINHTVSIKDSHIVYNYVTKTESITLSEGMTSAEGNGNTLDGRKVFTKLCSSYAWDTTLKFIEKTHPTYGVTSENKDGILVGQYNDNKYGTDMLYTGKTISVCSIYDLGGNAWEYTTECSSNDKYKDISRGGSFGNDVLIIPAGARNDYQTTTGDRYSFRPILFVV